MSTASSGIFTRMAASALRLRQPAFLTAPEPGPKRPPNTVFALAPGVEAHVHQHVFSFRFDMCVDGERNAVSEVNFAAVPMGEGNPHGNAIRIIENQLGSESQAQRNMDLATAALLAGYQSKQIQWAWRAGGLQACPRHKRAAFQSPGFAGRTPRRIYVQAFLGHSICERENSTRQAGIPIFMKAVTACRAGRKRIAHSTTRISSSGIHMNYHHLPRPEDWPVQPCIYASFHWMPSGFFDNQPCTGCTAVNAKALL